MSKKAGFLLGLLAGGAAAFLAFKRLDPVKRQHLVNQINHKATDFKNKAVDYAFYASDAMDDASGQLHRGANGAKSALNSADARAKQLKQRVNHHFNHGSAHRNKPQFHTATDHLRAELNRGQHHDGEIVINADRNFSGRNRETVIYYPDGTVKPA